VNKVSFEARIEIEPCISKGLEGCSLRIYGEELMVSFHIPEGEILSGNYCMIAYQELQTTFRKMLSKVKPRKKRSTKKAKPPEERKKRPTRKKVLKKILRRKR